VQVTTKFTRYVVMNLHMQKSSQVRFWQLSAIWPIGLTLL